MPRLVRRLRSARSAVNTLRFLNTFSDDELLAVRELARWGAEEHVVARRSPTISDEAIISPLASLRFTERVAIGPRTNIGPFAAIWGGWSTTWIRIGDGVMISPRATLVAGNHRLEGRGPLRDTGFDEMDVEIGDGAWIGAGATVIGCRVGVGAVVGAGAVLTTDVPDFGIAVGIPARVVGERPAA